MTSFPLSEQERRLNVEFRLRAVVSNFGGQYIAHGPAMDDMITQLADTAENMSLVGLLPPTVQPPLWTVEP